MSKVVIDLAALRHNYLTLQSRLKGNCQMMAVVKGDAYGHGLLPCVETLTEAGCNCFCVNSLESAISLRQQGCRQRLLVFLAGDAGQQELIRRHDLEVVIYDEQQLDDFLALPDGDGSLKIHLKVDCGMGRLGVNPELVRACCQRLQQASQCELLGLMSHFPCADHDLDLTRRHNETFAQALAEARQAGASPQAHIANSAALLAGPEFHWDMVRPGIALYGCPPGPEQPDAGQGLQAVMSVQAEVLQVKEVPAGTGVSYGLTGVTSRASRLAVVDSGYVDGYNRGLSNKAELLIHGQRVPILGRVCMSLVVVDVTDVADVRRGDQAVLLGSQGGEHISADEVAQWLGSISYEVVCMLGKNNSRSYINATV